MTVFRAENIIKEYRLGEFASIKKSVKSIWASIKGKSNKFNKKFKAIDDISFEIEKGEIVGIIGHNGAGKSTLLKIISNITVPTSGICTVEGKIAPMIEVGAGLHPELTGKENIYLNAAIMGISRSEIKKKFDDIVQFAELEKFIDTPLKRYSSGMKVKLGFSIVTSVEANILLVDEVLAVGDLAFQRKCFDRIENLIKRTGVTVLIVSHNIRQIQRLCKRVILLDNGRIELEGNASEVCNRFYEKNNKKIQIQIKNGVQKSRIRSSGEIEIRKLSIFENDQNTPIDKIDFNSTMRIGILFDVLEALNSIEIALGFHTTDFFYISTMTTAMNFEKLDMPKGRHYVECKIDHLKLTPGVYCIRAAFINGHRIVMHGENLATFRVIGNKIDIGKFEWGVIDIPADWAFSFDTKMANSISAYG